MKEILGNIYCWFESLFGQNLAEHLWGYNCETQNYESKIPFNTIGLITIAISFITVLIYYYIINHPRFNRWWSWLIVLLVTSFINLISGFWYTINDLQNGNIGDCLLYLRNEQGEILNQLIYEQDCWMFGFSNSIVAALAFIMFSLVLKWWSRNSKYSPI